ncbi:hypothetical protein SEA_EURATIS_49 [Streptomyces phage Euratis]|uniref:Uncharacterized protein n=1 Tax=Streptomyces phage Euratis TaxID=2510569 RepID=A0A411B136_9CAUD|nr:hypothetical protein SEA_EURATIS_49 [Streptomyces phage Euratis]
MRNKIIFPASIVTTAAVAFGLGSLNFGQSSAATQAKPTPSVSAPEKTEPTQDTDVQDVDDASSAPSTTPVQAAPKTAGKPLSAPETKAPTQGKGKHRKPSTTPEKPAAKAATPKHAKPAESGSKGPLKDADGDGAVMDDMGRFLVPSMPELPTVFTLFPDPTGSEGLPPYDGPVVDELPVPVGAVTYEDDGTWGNDPGSDPSNTVIQDPEAWAELQANRSN